MSYVLFALLVLKLIPRNRPLEAPKILSFDLHLPAHRSALERRPIPIRNCTFLRKFPSKFIADCGIGHCGAVSPHFSRPRPLRQLTIRSQQLTTGSLRRLAARRSATSSHFNVFCRNSAASSCLYVGRSSSALFVPAVDSERESVFFALSSPASPSPRPHPPRPPSSAVVGVSFRKFLDIPRCFQVLYRQAALGKFPFFLKPQTSELFPPSITLIRRPSDLCIRPTLSWSYSASCAAHNSTSSLVRPPMYRDIRSSFCPTS